MTNPPSVPDRLVVSSRIRWREPNRSVYGGGSNPTGGSRVTLVLSETIRDEGSTARSEILAVEGYPAEEKMWVGRL